MKFSIDAVLLWPKKAGFTYRKLQFQDNKINVITGSSRTGKSSIIPIIDYCLGTEKCAIPVDTIRNACEWFGVLFNLENEQLLLCRREPGNQSSTNEMYISRAVKVEIPDAVESNTNKDAVKNVLNELFSMSFLDLDPTNNNYSSRPSYRDFMAFLFQPQNIVANADVMFYKADTTEHRLKLINVFPYALGAVTPRILAARQEIEKLKKQRERVQRDIDTIKNVSESWKQEVRGWLSRAREFGLTTFTESDNTTFEEQIEQLGLIAEKTEVDSTIIATNIRDLSDEIVALRKEEQEISSQLFALQKRHSEMVQLKDSMSQYDDSLQIQVERLEISDWLRSMSMAQDVCPFCKTVHPGATETLDILCNAIKSIEQQAGDMKVVPAAFERELQSVETEMQYFAERLAAIRNRLNEESGRHTDNSEKKYTLTSISRFLGKMEATIHTYSRIGKDNDLAQHLDSLNDRISELARLINEREIQKKQDAALSYINLEAGKIVASLDAEHPDSPIEFIIKDLTIRVKTQSGRNDYLWEIGSASNWLAYHIAVILAFQQYFQSKGKVHVPNFVIFDQPSQVYFPRVVTKITADENAEETMLDDEDKLAVKKIFSAMDTFLKTSKADVQIIVTEHADEDVWGGIPSVHVVEKWRGNDKKLVPVEWL